MLIYDETPALAARARTVAKAVLGLLLEERRAARFVHEYSSAYFRQGIAGEAEHKAELLSAIERESLLLIAAHIERELPRATVSPSSRLSQPETIAAFQQAFLTYLGGTLAWDSDEKEEFHRDLAMYLRLAARESRAAVRRLGAPQIGGAFVDRCAFLLDPSMMAQAREATARYQAQLESCAGEALRAAFGRLRSRPLPALRRMPEPAPARRSKPKRKRNLRRPASPKPKPRLKPKPKRKAKAGAKPKPKPKPKPKQRARQRTKPAGKPRRMPRVGRKPVAKPRPKPRARPLPKPRSSAKAARKRRRVTLPAFRKGKSRPRRAKTPPRRKPPQRAKPVKRSARTSRKPKRPRAKK